MRRYLKPSVYKKVGNSQSGCGLQLLFDQYTFVAFQIFQRYTGASNYCP